MNKGFILLTIVLISLKWRSNAQLTDAQQRCRGAQESCRSCLLAHPDCAWCADNATAPSSRCGIASVVENSCPDDIQYPTSEISSPGNVPFTSRETALNNDTVIQLQPQKINARLRQGDTQIINITFRRVIDYPLDLYYVMDLSNSMRDDLETLQRLGISLPDAIEEFTQNFRLGFGTFVDKPMMPYASTVPALLQDPCLRSGNETCAPVFGFRHQLALTSTHQDFVVEVNKTRISGNIDSPEGGFDALMQIAVCQDQIRWNPDALRVIIFTTDASSHIAMDGKLAAILEVNDMQCHLTPEPGTSSWLYSDTELQDYPSIGQLKRVFEENKISTIFAVTQDVEPLYADLEDLLDSASVEVLSSDSSNVVEIIQTQYDLLRTEISLNAPTVPEHISMRYRAFCPGSNDPMENSLECTNVGLGQEVVYQFELTATSCPENPQQTDTIEISSGQIVDTVSISIEYLSCLCDCALNRDENSLECSGDGTLECGLCYCNAGATGQQCQCTASTTGVALESQCVNGPYVENVTPLCNNRGACECGECECDKAQGFFGDYCECSKSGCPNDCGGEGNGKCENCNGDRRCVCFENRGWTLNADTGDCSCNQRLCQAPNTTSVCSGRGECKCDTCECEDFLTGSFCNLCRHPRCTGIEDGCNGVELRQCAECVYEADRLDQTVATVCESVCTGRGIHYEIEPRVLDCDDLTQCDPHCEKCNYLSINPNVHVAQVCQSTLVETECDVTYKIFWNSVLNVFVVWVRTHNAESDCPGPVDPLLIVLPVVGGIVLLGLIALILWKIFQTIRDKHEYEQFLEEAKRSQWKTNENPLFEKPTDRIENPAYIGAN